MTDRASEAAGQVVLLPGDRETLRANGLFLAVRTMEAPRQVEHAPLRVSVRSSARLRGSDTHKGDDTQVDKRVACGLKCPGFLCVRFSCVR